MSISKTLWQVADDLRTGSGSLSLASIVQSARARGVQVSVEHVRQFEPLLAAHGQWSTPSTLIDLFIEIARKQKPQTVLDPWAGYGALLLPLAKAVEPNKAVAMTPNSSECELGQTLSADIRINWICGDPLTTLATDSSAVELIVSCPPFNYRAGSSAININGISIKDDTGNQIVAASLSKLSANGQAAIVLSPGTATSIKPGSLLPSLALLGLSLNGLLHLPSGFFAATSIESYVALISRNASPKVFIGQVREQKSHNDLLLANFWARKNGADVSLGLLIDADEFLGYKQLESGIATALLAKRSGLPPTSLSDIASEINLTKERDGAAFPDRDNAVYLPLIGNSKAVSTRTDLTILAHNYAQIVLDGEIALAPYVASFFNSKLGLLVRETTRSGTFIPKITKTSLCQAELYLPPLVVQRHCIDLDSRALNLMSEVQAIREAMWSKPRDVKIADASLDRVNREDNLKGWIDSLPFPLASILWTYHASGDDDEKRVEHLLHFFEALAEFTALVLWSAIKSSASLIGHPQYPLGEDKPLSYSLQHSSFGSWIEMTTRLSKFIRQRLSNKEEAGAIFEAFHTENAELLEMLTSKKVSGYVNSANDIRNKRAHGGITGRQDAKNNRAILENQLANFRKDVGSIWADLPLMKAGDNRFNNGVYRYAAELVMGRSYPFERTKVELTTPVDFSGLFLLPAASSQPIILEPLMIIAPSPQGAENACYFYNSAKGEELRYVSYHFEGEPEIIRTDDRASAALASLNAQERTV